MATNARNVLAAGTRFGRYEIVADIASGGMAMVYLARALGAAGFQRLVAIKVMHPQYANDEDFVGMFMDEARLAARIRHPNAVATLDLENDDDGLYLVMEYIEGDTLLSVLRATAKAGRRIPPPVTLRIILDMLNGLHAAHELTGDMGEPLRLVHRDVSPHNVLVGVDGISRITDFGIARAEERMTATKDGQVKGKLAYMAPEQTTSGSVDRRVDLFATGVVLWESLAGKRLFAGQSDGEVLRNLLVNPIPKVRDIVPDLPEALEQVCMKALERDADARYATAAQMADALESAGGSIGIASNRAVSQFLREVCGDRITAMQSRVRGVAAADATSAVRAVKRREHTDPERTAQRNEADMLMSPGTGSKRIPAPVPPTVDAELESMAPNRKPLVFGIVGAVVLIVGVSAFAMMRNKGAQTSQHPTAEAHQPAAPQHVEPQHVETTPAVDPTHVAAAADAGGPEAPAIPPTPPTAGTGTNVAQNTAGETPTTNAGGTNTARNPRNTVRRPPTTTNRPHNPQVQHTGGSGTFNPESM